MSQDVLETLSGNTTAQHSGLSAGGAAEACRSLQVQFARLPESIAEQAEQVNVSTCYEEERETDIYDGDGRLLQGLGGVSCCFQGR